MVTGLVLILASQSFIRWYHVLLVLDLVPNPIPDVGEVLVDG